MSNPEFAEKLTEPVRKIVNNFVHNHPGLQVTDDLKAAFRQASGVDDFARRMTWGALNGRTYGELEKAVEDDLVAAEALPPEEREEAVTNIVLHAELKALREESRQTRSDLVHLREENEEAKKATAKAEKRATRQFLIGFVSGTVLGLAGLAASFIAG
ncbi:hypothetical protein ACOQFV_09175 [Nocardiopsis changdeensis]|uniref:Uncharacterized protein n=1 Tax=Nocardiopsis changdeensis TaxID=2831969 RepID=A0ABX8BGY9_9ACTN|nr:MULTISPECIES: hypothetical protein [Nocardiopsis]QUX20287.1 hypothetical protein KGD84_17305 [Nocardiopsis changdeensis]QYX36217.1 hypothetical protein K1J57_26760 [Nocardiopsis sp. MT53]